MNAHGKHTEVYGTYSVIVWVLKSSVVFKRTQKQYNQIK